MRARLMPDARVQFVDDDGTVVRETEPLPVGEWFTIDKDALEVHPFDPYAGHEEWRP